MLDIEFQNPEWIHAIWGIVLLVLVFGFLEWRRNSGDRQFVAGPMRKRLARTTPLWSKLIAILGWGSAMSCLVFALMRPQYGFVEKKVPQMGAQIMVCLDVSKSMLAEDASPNRLERAKSELEVLLNYLDGDQVGLIAFAGSASVLCPMTTDFGFLKLLLQETTTRSVGRGGTLLETPIRRAMNGFADNDGMSKVILLITDGEDNGSKPLDAAREAAERGIRMITIGFGHERGSKIEITDPRTGIRSYVKDADGRDVVSRLDLDLLTRIATETKGACIPARVGSLDVEAIYEEHLRPLMRATNEAKVVTKNEAFQWPLLVGVILLMLTLLVRNPLAFSTSRFGEWVLARSTVRLIPWTIFFSWSGVVAAQDGGQKQPLGSGESAVQNSAADKQSTGSTKNETNGLGSEFSSGGLEDLVPEDPLEAYNQSVDVMQANPQYAEKLLEAARRDAGDNAKLRYYASYNLGWSKVLQANENLKDKPEEALRYLEAAADWFRESIRLRPKQEAARQNLEIVLRRIAELYDRINQKDPPKIEQQLDDLIQRQTELVRNSRRLIEYEQSPKSSSLVDENQRKSYRLASVDQRILNTDLEQTAEQANQQLEELAGQLQNFSTAGAGGNQPSGNQPSGNQPSGNQPSGNQPSGNQPGTGNEDLQQLELRKAQLTRALVYIDRAAQRLGQTRRQLRLQSAKRAALRGVLGLDELKRARDQLREPSQILRQIIADSELMRRQTESLVAGKNSLAAFLGSQPELPSWLDAEYLLQYQTTQLERTQELVMFLETMTGKPEDQKSDQNSESGSNPAKSGPNIEVAGQLVGMAVREFTQSQVQLAESNPRRALPRQVEALGYLREAYEQFADLKGLLELAYVTQKNVNQKLPAAKNLSDEVLKQAVESLASEIGKNSDRIGRVITLIQQEIQKVASSPIGTPDPQSPNPQSTDEEKKKLEYAVQLANRIQNNHQQFQSDLGRLTARSLAEDRWLATLDQASQLEQDWLELRRLFFSIVEHLKETVTRQQQLNSDTDQKLSRLPSKAETQAEKTERSDLPSKQESGKSSSSESKSPASSQPGLSDAERNSILPLASRQAELASISNRIGESLREMSETMSQQIQPGKATSDSSQKMMQQYADASRLVLEGKSEMDRVVEGLNREMLSPDKVLDNQTLAATKLLEALQKLEPPQNDEQQDQSSPSDTNQEQDEQAGSSQALLQRIRDREAQRRKDRKRVPVPQRVEKDW